MTIPFQNEAWKKPDPAQQLATIVSSGEEGQGRRERILNQRVEGDAWIDTVRATPIAKRRELTYSRTPDRKVFMIDHHVMEEDRVDQT